MSNMPDKQFHDAIGEPLIPFPDGRLVQCKPLPLSRASYWLRVGERAEGGSAAAEAEVFDEENGFFKEIGIREQVEHLMPLEAMVVFWGFFMVNRFRKNEEPNNPANEAPASLTST